MLKSVTDAGFVSHPQACPRLHLHLETTLLAPAGVASSNPSAHVNLQIFLFLAFISHATVTFASAATGSNGVQVAQFVNCRYSTGYSSQAAQYVVYK